MTSQAPKASQGLLRGDKKLVIAPCLEWAVVEARRRGWPREEWKYVRGVGDLRGRSEDAQLWQFYPEGAPMETEHWRALIFWRDRMRKVLYPFDGGRNTRIGELGMQLEEIACSFERSLRERSHHL